MLTADELFGLKDAKPRLEWSGSFATPGGEQGEFTKCWAYSIDGKLQGERVEGALFAGELMVVQSPSEAGALLIARDGLAETIRLLREEYDSRPAEDNAGFELDAAGRKGQGDGSLKTDPKLKAMLAHIIGGKPWTW